MQNKKYDMFVIWNYSYNNLWMYYDALCSNLSVRCFSTFSDFKLCLLSVKIHLGIFKKGTSQVHVDECYVHVRGEEYRISRNWGTDLLVLLTNENASCFSSPGPHTFLEKKKSYYSLRMNPFVSRYPLYFFSNSFDFCDLLGQ